MKALKKTASIYSIMLFLVIVSSYLIPEEKSNSTALLLIGEMPVRLEF